jgi:uncharacterized protein (DUF433 family)/antitoxin (DNA-binding transcriptional repressor) of toxin-antitoxin stability system
MVAVNTSDLTAAWPDLLARVRRGESVLLVENGEPVAQLGPAPAASDPDDEDDRPWRGVFAPEVPRRPIPGFAFSRTTRLIGGAVSMRYPRIVSDPRILMRKPVIAGTRISVGLIREEISAGASVDDLLTAYPQLTSEQILAAAVMGGDERKS